ncbi:hypothetical protein [uncultured Hydrogenophaga sp.]|uniref:hypothetical protein n=1 Tax=uncultured Hydrogenophaga sp. TaxID=199683 RepID=UPI00265E53C7|nr:hypothetical protein [uncultured Hydrogenophaga sp.]
MYESRSDEPLPRSRFVARLAWHLGLAALLLAASLGGGMWGYMHWEQLSAPDAFLNAAMLLGGMGPVNPPLTLAGKLFAGTYALYAGLVFIVVAALVLTPVIHRVLHRFHADADDD